jgi:hypothetical protein
MFHFSIPSLRDCICITHLISYHKECNDDVHIYKDILQNKSYFSQKDGSAMARHWMVMV